MMSSHIDNTEYTPMCVSGTNLANNSWYYMYKYYYEDQFLKVSHRHERHVLKNNGREYSDILRLREMNCGHLVFLV